MWHQAIIQSRKQLSPTVTGLTLQIIHQSSTPPPSAATTTHSNSNFTFVPGQWVDFQPHPTTSSFQQQQPPTNNKNKTIGGYSITSIPNKLPFIDLAIQSSRHLVATWVTCHAEVNDLVNLRVGGSFMYDNSGNSSSIDDDPTVQKATANDTTTTNDEENDELMNNKNSSTKKQQRLLFVAGGVGINPLFSMIQQWHFDQQKRRRREQSSSSSSSRAVLLYSAKQEVDLLFVTELNAMVMGELSDCFRVVLTTTTTTNTAASVAVDADNGVLLPQNDSTVGSLNGNSNSRRSNNILFRNGRVDHDMIKDAVRWINHNRMDNDKEVLTDDERNQEVEEEDDDIMIADQVYICGPPGMPEDIQRLLIPSSLQKDTSIRLVRSEDDVHYEKWW